MTEPINRDEIEAALHDVYDPETGLDIVDLGLVYDINYEQATETVVVVMTFTTPSCPAGDVMTAGVQRRLAGMPGIASVDVDVTFEPRWTPERISPAGREQLGFPL